MKALYWLMTTVLLTAGCSSTSVSRDYDKKVDFSSLKTYAWQHAEQPETGVARIDNDLMDERIRTAVNTVLAEKGLIPVSLEDADVLVAYYVDFKQRISGNSVSFGVGAGTYGRYSTVGYNTSIDDYEEGSLTIDFIDPGEDRMIWRGVGRRAAYEGTSPDKMTRVVNSSVRRILKKFPPR